MELTQAALRMIDHKDMAIVKALKTFKLVFELSGISRMARELKTDLEIIFHV